MKTKRETRVFEYGLIKSCTTRDGNGKEVSYLMFDKPTVTTLRPLGPAMLGVKTAENSKGHDPNWRPSEKFRLVREYTVEASEAPEPASFAEECYIR